MPKITPLKEDLQLPDFTGVEKHGLYIPDLEHDSCGVGVVANINGKPSHTIIEQGLTVLSNLSHRGATGSDPKTGDGAGILIQTPHKFLKKAMKHLGIALPKQNQYGVGMCFLPQRKDLYDLTINAIESSAIKNQFQIIGWRKVPLNEEVIGTSARAIMPKIQQVFLSGPPNVKGEDLERKLYLIRKMAEREVNDKTTDANKKELLREFYICSMSSRTVVYKGMLMPNQLGSFFHDLNDSDFVSVFSIVHSRFSTNTLGSWKLAHPYRFLAHNGEINTVRGNRNWMQSREKALSSKYFGDNIENIKPICESDDPSDTASLDNVFELLRMTGRSVDHVAAMMIPAAWYGNESMPKEIRDFYEYHGNIMEPWDGPAMVVFTDGNHLGAVLYRNGLRPFRYLVTKDDLLIMASETGVLPIEPSKVKIRSRLSPGKMFLVDFKKKRIVGTDEVLKRLASKKPYSNWLNKNRSVLSKISTPNHYNDLDRETLLTNQITFGYTQEDLQVLIKPMAITGHQPQGSMGNDAPLAVLSDKPQNLFAYFKQSFAQVSNPPLDAIREELVTQRAVPVVLKKLQSTVEL